MTSNPQQQTEFYLKGIYPVEIISEVKDGFVEVRTKTAFLHTSNYSNGKLDFRVGKPEKRQVRAGEVLRVQAGQVWSHRRSVGSGHA